MPESRRREAGADLTEAPRTINERPVSRDRIPRETEFSNGRDTHSVQDRNGIPQHVAIRCIERERPKAARVVEVQQVACFYVLGFVADRTQLADRVRREIHQDDAAGNPASERRPATGKQVGMYDRLRPADSHVFTARVGYPIRGFPVSKHDRPVVAPMGDSHAETQAPLTDQKVGRTSRQRHLV